MPKGKKRNLYLYGVLLCFIGIIVIFFVDGYLGVYDTVYVKSMEQEQKYEFETEREWKPYVFTRWGDVVSFRYEIDNRSFFSYSGLVEVSLWQSEKQVMEIFGESISVRPFDRKTLSWTLDTTKVEQPVGRDISYTLKIKEGKTEREFIITVGAVYIEEPPYPAKVPPPPPVPIE